MPAVQRSVEGLDRLAVHTVLTEAGLGYTVGNTPTARTDLR